MNAEDHIMIFDGVCNLCNGLVRFIIKRDHDGKIKFTPLQSSVGQSFIRKTDQDNEMINSVVYLSEGIFYYKSSAILRVLKDLGGGWKLFYVLKIFPGVLRDFIYDLVARNRYRIFGKRQTCMVPTEDIKSRFLT